MIKIAVCDNEKNVSDSILEVLSAFQEKHDLEFLVMSFSSGEELCQSETVFDLIFLGFELNGIDGIRTAARIRLKSRKTAIVYISGTTDCIKKIFAVHPFDFIEKPINETRVLEVLKDFYLYQVKEERDGSVVEFKGETGPLLLDTKDIYVFEYTGNRKITIFMKEQKYIIHGGIIKIIEKIDMKRFASPHKSFIINMDYVKSLTDYMIHMTNNISVPVAQKKLKKFKQELRLYFSDTEEREYI